MYPALPTYVKFASSSRQRQYHLAVLEAPHLVRRQRYVMRPSALEIVAGDFALAAGYRRIAISFVAAA
jgi:hypothetical protein